jgi:hypothetical protein
LTPDEGDNSPSAVSGGDQDDQQLVRPIRDQGVQAAPEPASGGAGGTADSGSAGQGGSDGGSGSGNVAGGVAGGDGSGENNQPSPEQQPKPRFVVARDGTIYDMQHPTGSYELELKRTGEEIGDQQDAGETGINTILNMGARPPTSADVGHPVGPTIGPIPPAGPGGAIVGGALVGITIWQAVVLTIKASSCATPGGAAFGRGAVDDRASDDVGGSVAPGRAVG